MAAPNPIETLMLVWRAKSEANYKNTANAFRFALEHFAEPESKAFLEEALLEITNLMFKQRGVSQQYHVHVESLLRSATSLSILMAREEGGLLKYGGLLRELLDKHKPVYAQSTYDRGPPRAMEGCINAAQEGGAVALMADSIDAMEGWPGHVLVQIAIDVCFALDPRHSAAATSPEHERIYATVRERFTELSDEELKKDTSNPPLEWLESLAAAMDVGVRFRFKLDVALKLLRSSALKFRLLAWEHIAALRNDAKKSGPKIPSRLMLQNSSRFEANGVYERVADDASGVAVWERRMNSEETGRDVVYTIQCFEMTTRSRPPPRYWFVSTGDEDFFRVVSEARTSSVFVPPRTGWSCVVPNRGSRRITEKTPPSEVSSGDPPESSLPAEEASSMELMRRWIVENNVIDDVFGERVHHVIVEKSAVLLRFLNDADALDKETIITIWRAALGISGTTEGEAVLKLLVENMLLMGESACVGLVNDITASIDDNFVDVVAFVEMLATSERALARLSVIKKRGQKKSISRIMRLVWMMMAMPSIELGEEGFILPLFRLLIRGSPKLLKVYLAQCFMAIEQSKAVDSDSEGIAAERTICRHFALANVILRMNLEAGATSRAGASGHAAAVPPPPPRRMEVEFYFRGGAVDVAAHTKVLCAEAVAFRHRCATSSGLTSAQLTLLTPRLDLLRFIVGAFPTRGGTLLLSVKDVKGLWKGLRSADERRLLLQWLAEAGMENHDLLIHAALSSEARKYVFTSLLIQDTDPRALSAAGWRCFCMFFLRINCDLKELEVDNVSALGAADLTSVHTRVQGVKRLAHLAGLNHLKEIALSAEDAVAAEGASKLFLALLSAIRPPSRDVLCTTLDFLFLPLSDIASADDVASISVEQKRRAQRAVDVLNRFVAIRHGLPPMQGVPHGLRGQPDLRVSINVRRIVTRAGSLPERMLTKSTALVLRTHRHMPVRMLLHRLPWAIAPSSNVAPGTVVSEFSERADAMSSSSLLTSGTLIEHHVTASSSLAVELSDSPNKSTALPPSADVTDDVERGYAVHPSDEIAHSRERFNMLSGLMEKASVFDTNLATQIWTLLMAVPTHAPLESRIRDSTQAGSFDWGSLLGGSAIATAYRLQIIAVHLDADGNEPLLVESSSTTTTDDATATPSSVVRLREQLKNSQRSASEVHTGISAVDDSDFDLSDDGDEHPDDTEWRDAGRAARVERRVEREQSTAAWRAAFVSNGGLSAVLGVIAEGDFSTDVQLMHVAMRIVKLCLREAGPAAAALATATGSSGAVLLTHALDQLPELDLQMFVLKLVSIVIGGHLQLVASAQPEQEQLLSSTILDVLTVLESLAHSSATATSGLSTPQMFPLLADSSALIYKTLLRSPSLEVREATRRTLSALAQEEPTCFRFVFNHCTNALESLDARATFSSDFFLLTADLLQNAFVVVAKDSAEESEVRVNIQRMKRHLWNTLDGWPRGAASSAASADSTTTSAVVGDGIALTASLALLTALESEAAVLAQSSGSLISDVECQARVANVASEWILAVPSASKQDGWPLSKHPASRQAAYDLLVELSMKSDGCLQACCEALLEFQRSASTYFVDQWRITPSWDMADSSSGQRRFVGLKNQGFTCYLNSLMQQLFMAKSFSSKFLESRTLGVSQQLGAGDAMTELDIDPDEQPAKIVGKRIEVTWVSGNTFRGVVTGRFGKAKHMLQYEDGDVATYQLSKGRPGMETSKFRVFEGELSTEEGQMQVIRQVKRTFCFLKNCVNSYYDPLPLVEACRTLRLDADVMQQHDASEVYFKLLDRIEEGTKKTEHADFVNSVFGVTVLKLKTCMTCGNMRTRAVTEKNLALEVKGIETVEEALQNWGASELMDGENKVECDRCKERRATRMQPAFGHTPCHLVLHLKRFALDYTTFETVKVNDRQSFPTVLNMKPFSKVGILEADEAAAAGPDGAVKSSDAPLDPRYEYHLHGVLIHAGVAGGGHYYSYIRDDETGEWNKFDDDVVTPWDPCNMERDCFGGTMTVMRKKQRYVTQYSNQREYYTTAVEVPRISNALMLFYKRAHPPTEEEIEEEKEEVRKRKIAAEAEAAEEAEAKRMKEALAAGDDGGGASGGGASGGVGATKAAEDEDSAETDATVEVVAMLEGGDADDALASKSAEEYGAKLDEYEELLWSSNEKAIRSVYALSPKYSGVLLRLLGVTLEPARVELYSSSTVQSLLKVALQCFFDIVIHRRHPVAVELTCWVDRISQHMQRSAELCAWFLLELTQATEHQWLPNMLMEKKSVGAQRYLCRIIIAATTSLVASSPDGIRVAHDFVTHLNTQFLDLAMMERRTSQEYFYMLASLAEIAPIGEHMRETNMVEHLITALLGAAKRRGTMTDIRPAIVALSRMVGTVSVPRPTLVDAKGAMTPELLAVTCDIFARYESSVHGGMIITSMEAMFTAVEGPYYKGQNQRAINVLQNFETVLSKDVKPMHALSKKGFSDYFTKMANVTPARLWRFVTQLGFAETLAPSSAVVPVQPLDVASLPRRSVELLRDHNLQTDTLVETIVEHDASAAYAELLAMLSYDNSESTDQVVSLTLERVGQILKEPNDYYDTTLPVLICSQLRMVFRCFERVLSIEDSLQRHRVKHIVDKLLGYARNLRNAKWGPTKVVKRLTSLIVCFVELREAVPAVRVALDCIHERWLWMLPYLIDAACVEGLIYEKVATIQKLLVVFQKDLGVDGIIDGGGESAAPIILHERGTPVRLQPLLSVEVRGAGSNELNGVYVADGAFTGARLRFTKVDNPVNVGTYVLKPDDRLRIFRCKVSHDYIWYISATGDASGTDKDVDFYQFQARRHIEYIVPPDHGWQTSGVVAAHLRTRAKSPPPGVFRSPQWSALARYAESVASSSSSSSSLPLGGMASSLDDLELASITPRGGSEDSDDSTRQTGRVDSVSPVDDEMNYK